jgi:hypothetical protein
VQPCTDRTLQVPGDPYSPPCYQFSGGNGGKTYQGVTDKDIIVTVRTLEGPRPPRSSPTSPASR